MNEWMTECRALVRYEQVWNLLAEWSWDEAYDTGLTPVVAVHYALLDVLAPVVAEKFVIGGQR